MDEAATDDFMGSGKSLHLILCEGKEMCVYIYVCVHIHIHVYGSLKENVSGTIRMDGLLE